MTWPWNSEATADSIRQFAHGYGDINPLYSDPAHAAKSRWGGLVAPPGFEWTMGVDRSPEVPEELAETRRALRGVHLFNAGHEGWFYKPVTPGVTLSKSGTVARVEDKVSEFAGRSVIVTNEHRWWDEAGDTYAVRRPWYVHAERKPVTKEHKYAKDERAHYTDEQIEEIDAAYDNEFIRGSDTLFHEDVRPDEALPKMVKGPFTVTDLINFFMGAGWYGYGCPPLRMARENRKRLRGFYSRNDFGSWDAIMRIHWEDDTARSIGVPAVIRHRPRPLDVAGALLHELRGRRRLGVPGARRVPEVQLRRGHDVDHGGDHRAPRRRRPRPAGGAVADRHEPARAGEHPWLGDDPAAVAQERPGAAAAVPAARLTRRLQAPGSTEPDA